MKLTDEYVVCSLEDAEAFARKRNINVTAPQSNWEVTDKEIDVIFYEGKTMKPNYVAEAPYHPGYEDAVIKPNSVYKGVDPAKMIWKPKPLSDEEVRQIQAQCHLRNVGYDTFLMRFARIIEQRHGIK